MLAPEKLMDSITKVISSLMEFVSGGKWFGNKMLADERRKAMESFALSIINVWQKRELVNVWEKS